MCIDANSAQQSSPMREEREKQQKKTASKTAQTKLRARQVGVGWEREGEWKGRGRWKHDATSRQLLRTVKER